MKRREKSDLESWPRRAMEKAGPRYDFYAPASNRNIRWNDPEIGVNWGIEAPILSAKDRKAPFLAESIEK